MHLLQLLNYYASIIYAAFLKGMSVESPGVHDHLFGFHHEEDYEAGSDALNEAMKYASHVEPVRTSLTSKLKVEQRLVGECLQGALLYIRKQSTEKSFTPAPLNNLLSYKKPLVKYEAYDHKTWMRDSYYHKQFLLPSTHVSKHIDELITDPNSKTIHTFPLSFLIRHSPPSSTLPQNLIELLSTLMTHPSWTFLE